jgi:hypothetical protein
LRILNAADDLPIALPNGRQSLNEMQRAKVIDVLNRVIKNETPEVAPSTR